MNPYLEKESYWQDFHQTFIPTARSMLAAQVAPHYFVRVEQHVFVHELQGDERRLLGRPDIHVKDIRPSAEAPGTATIAPAYGYLPATSVDQEIHSYLTIRDREGHNVITVIELLSPSNKNPGADRVEYLRKRRAFFAAGAHVVEIDLLRAGPRLPLSDVPPCDYLVSVSRAEERPRVGLWPVQLRQRLPTIPIPLRAPDADAQLDLQEALDRIYDSAGYAPLLYDMPPEPPLSDADLQWARQLLEIH
jgi:hypothetical protein